MKKNLILIFYFLMMWIGIIRFFYWLNRDKKIILTYHNVIPDELYQNLPHLGVSHSQTIFEKQIAHIKKRFFYKSNISDTCLITFDDGYKNQLEIAAKTLEEHDMQGIFFISFQSLVTANLLMIDKILMWVSYVPEGKYILLTHEIYIKNDMRDAAASKIYQLLLNNFKLWEQIESELDAAFSFSALQIETNLYYLRFIPLNENDLKKLIQAGHIIGAHSWNHLPLSTLPTELQKEDFVRCAELSNKYCNSKLYSYPFGGLNEVSQITTEYCKEVGFKKAYMNINQLPNEQYYDLDFVIPRMSLPNESNRYLLDAKLSGFETFCKKCINKLSIIRLLFPRNLWKKSTIYIG